MATRIVRDPEAFSLTGTRKKRPREKANAHLNFIRSLPCCLSGKRPVEAAHVRYADLRYGKAMTGGAEKPHDKWTVPLHPDLHRAQHAFGDEREWWRRKGVDPLDVAARLWVATGDEEAAELILKDVRKQRKSEATT